MAICTLPYRPSSFSLIPIPSLRSREKTWVYWSNDPPPYLISVMTGQFNVIHQHQQQLKLPDAHSWAAVRHGRRYKDRPSQYNSYLAWPLSSSWAGQNAALEQLSTDFGICSQIVPVSSSLHMLHKLFSKHLHPNMIRRMWWRSRKLYSTAS